MNNAKLPKHGNGLPFEILKWGLLIYTGYRSLDILGATMPEGNTLMAIPALLGLDVGVLVWSYLYEKKAEGNQAALSALLTVADVVGVGLCLLADSIMHSNQAAQYKDLVDTVTIWLVAIVIFLNVVGGILYPMLSPQAQRDRQEKEMEAAYSLKSREAENEHLLAQIELKNARIRRDARQLLMEATGTFHMPAANAQPQPQTQTFGKDSGGEATAEEMAAFLEWRAANKK